MCGLALLQYVPPQDMQVNSRLIAVGRRWEIIPRCYTMQSFITSSWLKLSCRASFWRTFNCICVCVSLSFFFLRAALRCMHPFLSHFYLKAFVKCRACAQMRKRSLIRSCVRSFDYAIGYFLSDGCRMLCREMQSRMVETTNPCALYTFRSSAVEIMSESKHFLPFFL